jgi:hypothetical protein
MPISSIDTVQLFDIDLGRAGNLPDVRGALGAKSPSEAYKRCCDSFTWLFEPQATAGGAGLQDSDPTVAYLSQEVNCPYSLPGFDRFSLESNQHDHSDKGGLITISQALKVAVLGIWRRHEPEKNPLHVKRGLSADIPRHYLDQLSVLFPHIAEGELMYPFLAVRYDSTDLQEVLSRDGVALGRLFSGGLDHEADDTLRAYLKDNLSIRKYEGLFLRTSDGLGVYTSGIEETAGGDLLLYENTLFRAVQVCELCLLEHRLARSFKLRVDQDARKVRIFPRPFLVEKRRTELLGLEMGMVKSLPFRAPEAPALVRRAQEKFSIPEHLRDAKDSYDFLEIRYQNSKTTALAVLAVAAYILDKMHVWDGISGWVQAHAHLVLSTLGHHG